MPHEDDQHVEQHGAGKAEGDGGQLEEADAGIAPAVHREQHAKDRWLQGVGGVWGGGGASNDLPGGPW